GVDEPPDALRLARLRHDLGALGVDLLVGPRVELRGGVVRQTGEMQDRVAVLERGRVEGPDVSLDELDLVAHLGEALVAEVELVEHADGFALVEQLPDRDAADVAGSACDENHASSL